MRTFHLCDISTPQEGATSPELILHFQKKLLDPLLSGELKSLSDSGVRPIPLTRSCSYKTVNYCLKATGNM